MAKLIVNIAEGTIEIEGDEKFVLNAFTEVRAALKEIDIASTTAPKKPSPLQATPNGSEAAFTASKAKAAGKPKGAKAQPTLNPNLNLIGLDEFVASYKPGNNMEKILVFAAFLRDKLSMSNCSDDAIFSCFHNMKSSMKIPQAFGKNLNDAKNAGYIDYSKLSEITIPTMGENHLIALAKKVASE